MRLFSAQTYSLICQSGFKVSVIEETLLAETLALRTILLNAFYKLAQGGKLSEEEMQAIIERADAAKAARASDGLRQRLRRNGSEVSPLTELPIPLILQETGRRKRTNWQT